MVERAPTLQVGDPIPGEKVNPRTIAMIIDLPVGHLLVDEEHGNVHIYWYRWLKQGTGYRRVLTHHGGPNGFNDIQMAIDQHQRVISKYIGVDTDLPAEPGEELLRPPFTLRTYAQALRIGGERVEIPGERAWMNDCLYILERVIRGAATKMPAADLQNRLYSLTQLQPKFERSGNPYMQRVSRHLVQAVESAQAEKRDETMVSLLEMGQDMTKRVSEISGILAATIRRDSLLEHLRNSMEDVVAHVHFDVVRAKGKWDQTKDDGERQRIISNLTNLLGIRKLSELTVQPFRGRVKKRALVRLGRLGEYWASGDMERVGRVLTDGSKELIAWRRQIRKRVEGDYRSSFPTVFLPAKDEARRLI